MPSSARHLPSVSVVVPMFARPARLAERVGALCALEYLTYPLRKHGLGKGLLVSGIVAMSQAAAVSGIVAETLAPTSSAAEG